MVIIGMIPEVSVKEARSGKERRMKRLERQKVPEKEEADASTIKTGEVGRYLSASGRKNLGAKKRREKALEAGRTTRNVAAKGQ